MKVKNRFLLNYILVFLLTSGIAFIAVLVLGITSGRLENSLVKNRYTAEQLMKDELSEIQYAAVLQNHGGVQVISREYKVILSQGISSFPKEQLTAAEFTEFLAASQSIRRNYSYSIAYNEKQSFWLIVTFPTSLRIDFNIAHNSTYPSQDTGAVTRLILLVLLAYLALLAASTLIYSRLTAASVTKPLMQLRESAGRLSHGDYSARADIGSKNEFGELEQSFNTMADRIQQEMELRKKSEALRKQLTLDIAHDLKNPLAVIQGYAEYCLKNPSQDPGTALTLIYQNSLRANSLINGLFALSKLESPDYRLNLQRCDICEYLRTKGANFIPSFESAGFQYGFELPESESWVNLDTGEMDRVMDNLFDNALRYNAPGTRLELKLEDCGTHVSITVADDGRGIPKAKAVDIFKPFTRTDESRNSETGGSGLGLAIAEKIVKLHGGEILLDSDTGRGCRFVITLPKS